MIEELGDKGCYGMIEGLDDRGCKGMIGEMIEE